MKRILALALALMMLFGMTALAEEAENTALVSSLYNVELSLTQNGETSKIALDDFSIVCAMDTAENLQFSIDALKGDDELAFAIARLVNNELHVAIEGIDTTYVVQIPDLAGQDTTGINELVRAALPELVNMKLPLIDAPAFPKLDMAPLVQAFATGTTEADGATQTSFTVPAEVISLALDQIIEIIKASADSIPQGSQIVEVLNSIKDSGIEISLGGVISDEPDGQTASIDIFVGSDTPALTLKTESVENRFALAAVTGDTTLGQIELTSDPAQNEINFTTDIMGMVNLALSFYRQDDLQCVNMTFTSGEETIFTLDVNYGVRDGHDYSAIAFTADEVSISAASETVLSDEGSQDGAINVTVVYGDQTVTFDANISTALGTYDLNGYEMPAATASIDDLKDADVTAALQPLTDYFASISPAA